MEAHPTHPAGSSIQLIMSAKCHFNALSVSPGPSQGFSPAGLPKIFAESSAEVVKCRNPGPRLLRGPKSHATLRESEVHRTPPHPGGSYCRHICSKIRSA